MSLAVRKGEVVGLLGPNGAGKTTSFYMIVGLVRADAGDITHRRPVGRHTCRSTGVRAWACRYLPQEASIFRKLTVAENVRAVLELQRDGAGQAACRRPRSRRA